ncbi:MAG: hypothetical protein JSW35_02200 [Deltaproteobacteria bacterium]|nr:MAG: hypothetical protein JSW35_02200 [Deltaproteobacteria bacterium]
MKDSQGIRQDKEEIEGQGFGELLRYTVAGFAGGLIIAALLDSFGLQRSPVGQWIVRTLSGEGESILEGFYAFRRRMLKERGTLAEAYGWGKFFGMIVPWIIDWGSRILGVNVYGVEGFYIPYFYAMSDQIGANVSGLIFIRRKTGSFSRALLTYFRQPVMLTSLVIIFVVPAGLLSARLMGFSPKTQILTALETIVANLCWLPPFLGWLMK